MKRHIWPGNAAYRIGEKLSAQEIEDQVIATRQRLGSPGNIFFSMKSFLNNVGDINGVLKRGVYSHPALIPATPWVDRRRPEPPKAAMARNGELRWNNRRGDRPFLWVVYVKKDDNWETIVLPQSVNRYVLPRDNSISMIAVSAVDRLGNESRTEILIR